jgi:calcineurin-like phosphoesterase family protein
MPHILFAVGDMAGPSGSNPGSAATAALIKSLLAANPGSAVLVLGDNAYDNGTETEYETHYASTWGDPAIRSVTFPCPGNHDYHTPGATPYYAFFGSAAGPADRRGFYSFDWNGWHLVSLNTEENYKKGSSQLQWLEQDLRAHDTMPTIVFFHRPRFGSGGHGDSDNPQAFWDVLFAHHVEIVLCGHAHHYERFAPQDPKQHPHSRGIRQFIVGTGGRELVPPKRPGKRKPNSETADGTTFGVLKLTLDAASYQWEFVPAKGSFTDRSVGPHAINH